MRSNIGKLIAEKGLQKKYVAEAIGVSTKQLWNYDHADKRSYPPIPTAFKLAKVLGVKVDDLYDEDSYE